MKNCAFCQIVNQKENPDKLYEDAKVLVMLDEDWAVKGHTLVIWKTHVENASDLSQKEFQHFAEVFRKTEKVLLKTLHLNNAIILKSGGLVPHFHFHIYPTLKEAPRPTLRKLRRLIEKKSRYQPRPGEKESLIAEVKSQFEIKRAQ